MSTQDCLKNQESLEEEVRELFSGFSCNFYGKTREEVLFRIKRFLEENAQVKDHSIEEERYSNGYRIILYCYYHTNKEVKEFMEYV